MSEKALFDRGDSSGGERGEEGGRSHYFGGERKKKNDSYDENIWALSSASACNPPFPSTL